MSTNQLRRYLDLLNEADLVPPNTNVALPSAGSTFSNDQALANLAGKMKDTKTVAQSLAPNGSNTDSPEGLELLRQIKSTAAELDKLSDTDITEKAASLHEKLVSLLSQLADLPPDAVSDTSRQQALDITKSTLVKIQDRIKYAKAKEAASDAPNSSGATPTGGAEDGQGLAGGQRCAVCGTPKMDHGNLTHPFQPGGNTRPEPVPQGGSGGGADVSRIKQLQRELLAAGAKNLGTTGPNHDGIDGDIGPRTLAAMEKYPDIAAKYKDISGGSPNVAPPAQSKVSVEQLRSALNTIENILRKYKISINEQRELLTPADQMRQWRQLMEYSELTELDRNGRPTKAEIAAYMNNYAYGDDPSEKPTRKSPTRNSAAPVGSTGGAGAFDAMAGQLGATPASTRFGQGTNMPTSPYQVPGASTSPNPTPAAPAAPAGPGNPNVQRPGGSREAQAWQAQQAARAAETGGTSAASHAAQAGAETAAKAGAETVAKAGAGFAGKTVGKLLPGVGVTLSAMDAKNRWDSGDKSGAVIAALAGAGWLIPGPLGWAIGGGLDATNLARDLSNRVAISDDDAKIIRANLPVIVSWQLDPENAKNPPPGVQEEIARVMKALRGVGIEPAGSTAPTQSATTPGTTPGTSPATTAPATTAPTANSPAAAKLAPTLDGIDALLKKYNFESQDFELLFNLLTEREQRKYIFKNLHLLSESEQMAARRDLLSEGLWGAGKAGLQWLGKTLFKAGGGSVESDVAKAVRQATDAAHAAGKTPAEVAQAAAEAADAAHKAAKPGWRPGFWTGSAATAAAGVYGYVKIKDILASLLGQITDPATAEALQISPDDTAAWIQFNKELQAAIPTQAAYDALPQETKDRLSMIAARAEAMDKAMKASRNNPQ